MNEKVEADEVWRAKWSTVLGVLILVSLGFTAKDSTLTVKVNEPDSDVQVFDEDGKIEIVKRIDAKGTITIPVDPGKHRLNVSKNGFNVFTKDFEIVLGGKKTITAKLVRKKEDKEAVKWRKRVGNLPVEQQVEAVVKKLQELNPGFDGNTTHKIEDGVVTELKFLTNDVTDISPIRALGGLMTLNCSGEHPSQGKLSDLSPLQGMMLTSLVVTETPVTDLSPLKGMPVTTLNITRTPVFDISPLKDMPLTFFSCYGTQVADLSPLKNMKLTYLICNGSKVQNLSPLKGMPMTCLECSGTEIIDLTPLKGMPLSSLTIGKTLVSDLSPLKEMKLATLQCNDTHVSNLSPLAGMPLKVLSFDFTPESDTTLLRSFGTLETINGKPVTEFWKEVEAQKKGTK